ncbi:MAG TPA: DUF1080 domain-containing protein [Candidatus Hydrogenedentes bacterium]|nr:DUF1080 domain-containing protein [Candidatus Hydrogenedentota bacterium]
MNRYYHVCSSALLVMCIACITACPAQAQRLTVEEMYPSEPDPFMGNWEGRWSDDDVDPTITAQVFPLGRGRYQIRLAAKLFMRCPTLAIIETPVKNGALTFNEQGYQGEIRNGRFTGARRTGRVTFEMKRTTHEPPTLGAAPPENAIVLFNGANFDSWNNTDGWELTDDGAMMVTPDAGDLVSKKKFKDVRLHVEFRTPLQPNERGQSRGNSGVFVQDVYEVQVLDSYGLEGTYDECGALYKVSAPYVNAALPPTQWQTYDITYRAARFNDDGTVREYPRMTVLHNGFVIQHEQEIPWITAWKEVERLQPPPVERGAVKLQSHRAHYVQYRNIWVVDMEQD